MSAPQRIAGDILAFGVGRGPLTRADLVRWYALPLEEQARRNRAHLDRLVLTWDKACSRMKRDKRKRSTRRLMFLHIPKAGGTTLDNIIAKNYDINAVMHINFLSVARNPRALYKDGTFPPVVLGHFKMSEVIYQCPRHGFAHITMLREPIDRLISYYNFLLAAPRHRRHKDAVSKSFVDFARSKDIYECHNEQALRLAGLLTRKPNHRAGVCERALELAKENLLRRFTFFGTTEKYVEFLLTARRILGWRDPHYTRRKVTRSTGRRVSIGDIAHDALEEIRHLNRFDIELHRWATAVCDERFAALDLTEHDVEAFKERNKTYQELLAAP